MAKYKIYLNQYVTAQVKVELEVESDKSVEELDKTCKIPSYESRVCWNLCSGFIFL